MAVELSPSAVSRRLAELRARFVAETIEEGRARLAPPPAPPEPLAQAASRRLAELRALSELTAHLRGAKPR